MHEIVTFADEVARCHARLRRFARRLAKDPIAADDLVQETFLHALTHADQFRPGTQLFVWLEAILRNTYFKEKHQDHRCEPLENLASNLWPSIGGEQESHRRFTEVALQFSLLSLARREALMLVGANGHSYCDAAKVAGCSVGTMKSRVARARANLQENPRLRAKYPLDLHARDFAHLAAAA
jgi:RNA polymerase sigma-70 factor, ECF subfamily